MSRLNETVRVQNNIRLVVRISDE